MFLEFSRRKQGPQNFMINMKKIHEIQQQKYHKFSFKAACKNLIFQYNLATYFSFKIILPMFTMTHYGHIFDEGPNNFIYIIHPKNDIFIAIT